MKTCNLLLGVVLALGLSNTARAVTMYGALGNFDAINDTGSTAHGFEIELNGCSPADVSYFFGDPYNRYGNPTVTPNGTGGVIVRYASTYDSNTQTWAAGTDSGILNDTGGHSLFNGGFLGYPGTVPGDHFGVGLNVNPTNTTYRWLLDGGNGTLTPAGTSVKIPAPVLTVVPPANPANPAGVQAAIQAPPNPDPINNAFGEAIWAKVFTTEVQAPEPVELIDLVLGNPAVPPDTETEIEWQILQAGKNGFDERGDEVDLGDGNESVTRRYDFYKYIGPYDAEGEALFEDPTTPEALAYNDGLGVVGDFIGRQNVAANIALVDAVPEPATFILAGLGLVGLGYVAWRKRYRRA